MHVAKTLSPEILKDVEKVLETFREKCIPVYEEAEKLRKRWISENIALEDCVAAFTNNARKFNAAVAFDQSEARQALLGDDS